MVKADGSCENAYRHFYKQGLRAFVDVWPFPSLRAWKMVLSFIAFEAFLLVLLPGERFMGPSTPAGNRPLYTVFPLPSNFPLCEVVTVIMNQHSSLILFGNCSSSSQP